VKELIAHRMPAAFIAGKFCHRHICLTSDFTPLSHCF
jgi:hypothetical protein